MRTNSYPGHCANCGNLVAVNAGTLIGPPYEVICSECVPLGKAPAERVSATLTDGRVELIQRGHLSLTWTAYQTACGGLTRNRKLKRGWVRDGALEDAPELISRLKAIPGLEVEISETLAAAMKQLATDRAADVSAAGDRMAKIDAALASRGQALFGFQRTGIPWLAARDRALLADEMGLGKTLQALLAAPTAAPILVICPAVAKGVWVREAAKWRPDLTPVALKGRKSFRWPISGEMVVVNYDILPPQTPAGCPEGLVLIADEAHAVKNAKAARTKRFRSIAKATAKASGKVWLLTATPMLNRPPELWALLQGGGMGEVFGSWSKFVEAFDGAPGRWGGYEWGQPADYVGDLLKRVQLRRLKADVLTDLPAKQWQEISVNGINAKTRKLCDAALDALDAAGVDLEESGKLIADGKGTAFEKMAAARAALAAAKIPHLVQLVEQYEESETPLVVFSAHRAPVEALAAREGWEIITGDVSPEKRSAIEDRFQSGTLKGVAATVQAGGVAITLTHASNAVFVDRMFTPALNAQAEDRLHRIGQDSSVNIIDLVAGHPLDERLYQILCAKQRLITASIDQATRQADETDDRDLGSLVDSALAWVEIKSADEYQELLAEISDAIATRKAQTAETKWQGKVRDRASRRKIEIDPGSTERRDPATPAEVWAATGLSTLTALDPDHATDENAAGFNKADGWIGHQLTSRLAGGLTSAEWALSIGICRKYHRQIGQCP